MLSVLFVAFLLLLAFLFVLFFWSSGVGAWYAAAFIGTLAVATASSIRQAVRRNRG
jgi:hypothetical protein